MSYFEGPSDLLGKSFGIGSPDSAVLPKLRSDIVIREQTQGQEVIFVFKDPVAQAYYRFDPVARDIISLFDGNHSPEQAVEEHNTKHPLAQVDESILEAYRKSLWEMELLEIPAAQKSLILMDRIRNMRKQQSEGSLFFKTISAWDPDKFFDRVIPYVRWLWTKQFFAISLTFVLIMVAIDIVKWDQFKAGLIDNYAFSKKSLWDMFVFIFLMTATGLIHEIGHGMTLKNYGGEVHKLGFLIFYLGPAFFCDVSDSYILTSRKERLWITFAGSYSELCVCSLATIIWFFAVPGTLLYEFSFKVLLFTGISSFFLNMNPLVKLDGYYALMDWLGIMDLRERAFAYLQHAFKKNILRQKGEAPEELTKRLRRIFIAYAIPAMLYTSFIYYLLLGWVRNIYLNTFGQLGIVLLLATIYWLFRKNINKAVGFMKFLYLDKKEIILKKKNLLLGGSIAVVLLFIFLIPKTHVQVRSPFVIQPEARADIRSETDGFLQKVLVHENDQVKAGQPLAYLTNPTLAQNEQLTSTSLEMLDRELSSLQLSGDSAGYAMKLRSREQVAQQKEDLDKKISKLTIRAPISGVVMTPRVEEKTGTYLSKGTLFCTVADVSKVKVELSVSDYLIQDVHPGHTVVLKPTAYPTQSFEGTVSQISPAAGEEIQAIEGIYTLFRVTAIIDNADRKLLPGMEGNAKILGDKYSLGRRFFRELNRWIFSKVW
ncbi:MAG: hypothetical protein C5B54_05285 [Acidobacteria bacterium]|nr:MAG: hypothetical protein C5B54_05285 [Acidobacteriota bacterium]